MQVFVSRSSNRLTTPVTPTELESAACDAVVQSVEFFEATDVRFGPEGLYLLVDGKVHILSFDVRFVRTMLKGESVPVTFDREET